MKTRKISKIAALGLALIIISALCLVGCGSAESMEEASKRMNTYTIDAVYNDKSHIISAVETLSYTNRTGARLEKLCFNLYPNAYREDAVYKAVSVANRVKAYPHGASWGRIDINYVKVEGTTCDFEIGGGDRNILVVNLPVPLSADGSMSVEINFATTLANTYDRLGWNDKTVLITNFYPVVCVYENGQLVMENYSNFGDPFYSETANYSVNFTYPDKYNIAHTGDRLNTAASGGNSTATMRAVCVRDFAIALSAPKTMVSMTKGKLIINYHYINDKSFEENLKLAEKAMTEYSEIFGEYPYSKIEIFETPFANGGMEYPGLVLVASAQTTAERTEVIVHELCHQWWYGLVGNNQHNTAWIDEGLADFCTLLFFQKYPEYGIDKNKRVRQSELNYALFVDVLKSLNENDDTTMTRKLSEYGSEREYVFMTYVKGMLMFESLHKSLGEKAFLRSLQKLYKDNLFGIVSEADVISAFSEGTRKDLNSFFRAWLDGKVVIARLSA